MNKSPKTWGDVLLAASEKELTGSAVLTRASASTAGEDPG